MPISSDSLFHLTSSFDTLKKILSNGLLVSVSHEGTLLEKRPYNIFKQLAIPMVCFCDIPLGQIQGHANVYSPQGAYGIGLTRDWGLNKKCTPVSYVHEHSPLLIASELVNDILSEFSERYSPSNGIEYSDYLVKSSSFEVKRFIRGEIYTRTSFRAFLYVKSYKGYYFRNGEIFKDPLSSNYNFYDEREWRYVPPDITSLPEFLYPPFIEDISRDGKVLSATTDEIDVSHSWYMSEVDKLKQDRRFLSFSAADITHIIVSKEEEARELIDFLLNYSGKTFGGGEILDESQKSVLISKITRYSDLKINISV